MTASPPPDARPVLWEQLSWPQLQALRDGGPRSVLLPVGATEQHGPHLPVNTDTAIATAVCRHASGKTGVPVLPAVAYGCSIAHTEKWPGTLSLYPETLYQTVREIAHWLHGTGWRKLLIVNSHFGNWASLRMALDRVRYDFGGELQVLVRNSWELSPAIKEKFLDDADDLHANRAETALMLAIAPKTVRADLIPTSDDPDRTRDKVFPYMVPHCSTNGVTGHPSRATRADGLALLAEMGDALAQLVVKANAEDPPLNWSKGDARL